MRLLLPLLFLACTDPAPRLVPDPGPVPREAPRSQTLLVGDDVVNDHVVSQLSRGPRGIAYTRSLAPPTTNVWLDRRQLTTDGRSDRPFQLPDGTLLWISSAGGQVHWVRDGVQLTASGPVPAFPAKTRFVEGKVVFDAGAALFRLDPKSGSIERLSQ